MEAGLIREIYEERGVKITCKRLLWSEEWMKSSFPSRIFQLNEPMKHFFQKVRLPTATIYDTILLTVIILLYVADCVTIPVRAVAACTIWPFPI